MYWYNKKGEKFEVSYPLIISPLLEESVSKQEKHVSVLDYKLKNTDHLVIEVKQSLNFCEDEIVDIKKAAHDLKEDQSSTSTQANFLKYYSRRK